MKSFAYAVCSPGVLSRVKVANVGGAEVAESTSECRFNLGVLLFLAVVCCHFQVVEQLLKQSLSSTKVLK